MSTTLIMTAIQSACFVNCSEFNFLFLDKSRGGVKLLVEVLKENKEGKMRAISRIVVFAVAVSVLSCFFVSGVLAENQNINSGRHPFLGLDLTRGWFSTPGDPSNTVIGVGAFLKIPHSPYVDFMGGVDYIAPPNSWSSYSAMTITYGHLDICGRYSFLTGSLGVIYPLSNADSTTSSELRKASGHL